jgi:hypothetical protein
VISFGSFGGKPFFLSLSFSLIHLDVQGSGCWLAIVCELCVCMLLVSLPHDVFYSLQHRVVTSSVIQ